MDEGNEIKEKGIRRLYRSRQDRVAGGVCGGLAEYLKIDPIIIRIIWAVSIFPFVFGFVLYVIALFIIPENPYQTSVRPASIKRRENWNILIGVVLVIFGSLLLLDQIGLFHYSWFRLQFIPWRLLWPLTVIGVGTYFVVGGKSLNDITQGIKDWAGKSSLGKSRSNKMIGGLCGGLGETFGIDPTIIRLVWSVAAIITNGIAILIYFIVMLILPYKKESNTSETSYHSNSGEVNSTSSKS